MEINAKLRRLLRQDRRYKLEAYRFIQESLGFAQSVLKLGEPQPTEIQEPDEERPPVEPHLTGHQLCEAIRQYAIDQYGYMAKVVLNSWGLHTTGDFGEIVYNLISIGHMRKSKTDRREDFDDVFDFEDALQRSVQITRRE